jgi:predicted nucleic acid-binding protein
VGDFDFDAAQRWARFDPKKTLTRRPDDELPFVDEERIGGQPLLLDTCVYIDQMQGRSPDILDILIDRRQVNHSTVAIQELMHTVGVLDPRDARTAAIIGEIRRLIRAMPAHRVFAPEPDVLGKAALLSGMLCRLQRYAADAKLRALQDCVLFLQAQKLGFAVLTANISDYDYLLQLIPAARVLFYRRE